MIGAVHCECEGLGSELGINHYQRQRVTWVLKRGGYTTVNRTILLLSGLEGMEGGVVDW